MQSQRSTAPAAALISSLRRNRPLALTVRTEHGYSCQKQFHAGSDRARSRRVRTIDFLVDPTAQCDTVLRSLYSCRTLEQIQSCQNWIDTLTERGVFKQDIVAYLNGAVSAARAWLERVDVVPPPLHCFNPKKHKLV